MVNSCISTDSYRAYEACVALPMPGAASRRIDMKNLFYLMDCCRDRLCLIIPLLRTGGNYLLLSLFSISLASNELIANRQTQIIPEQIRMIPCAKSGLFLVATMPMKIKTIPNRNGQVTNANLSTLVITPPGYFEAVV